MLETKKVFIDTQSFVKAGLHFDNSAFKAFKKYCKENELYHVSTSVVEREVKSKIQLSVNEAISAIKNFRRKAQIISSFEDEKIKGLFVKIPDKDIHMKSEEVFNNFMKECSTEIVEANDVDAEELLSLYFGKKPPFGDEKKKSEFPDAISLLSLKSYLKEGEKIYIVSDDGDLKTYCASNPSFISVESLEQLLDIYTAHTNTRNQQLKQYFVDNESLIKQKITEYLEDCEVYNNSTWEDAEVDDGLTIKYLGNIDPSVLYIDDEESQISFSIDADFKVTVTGPDFSNAIYDSEDGRAYVLDSISRVSEISTTFTVEMYLQYDFINGNLVNTKVNGLHIAETSGGIEVSVEENEHDWY